MIIGPEKPLYYVSIEATGTVIQDYDYTSVRKRSA